ncbi:sodium-coupled monocarboxylate transporter 1-like [Apostichopus japonicus]|uniref:sodium-coupled monocarboxylate transporter 1-like n=1 Tax=Stichopus japonicus TaxID=307972 RepID=UPI003AB2407C
MLTMAYLAPLDYIVLIIFLMFSAGVGVYHAVRGDRQRSADQYLLANRSMHPIPVAISVIVSVLSAVTFLGTPAEVYIHGPQYWVVILNKVIPFCLVVFSFCPLFYRLQVTSIYEYLDMRFGKAVRYLGVTINFVYLMIYMGIVVYGPALALNAVTGISLAGSILAVGFVCTFYTTIGGITAVVWTDVFQSVVMLLGFLVILVASSIQVGGLVNVFEINARDRRDTFLDFRLNPTIRHSFWSVFIGYGFLAGSYVGTNQIIVQRYMTCRNLKQSQLAAGIGTIGIGVVEFLAVLCGMSMYAYFAGCDPLTSGKIQSSDQLMPFIMVELFQKAPGVAGLLISAAFSASLSTVSSGVNALATMTGQDFIRYFWPDMEDFKFTLILKCVSIFFGLGCICMAFLASVLGEILPLTLSVIGILNGPLLGVFSLGTYFPRANSKGAICGIVIAMAIGTWLKLGAMAYPPIIDDPPLLIDQCHVDTENVTSILATDWMEEFVSDVTPYVTSMAPMTGAMDRTGIARLYGLSHAYYTPLTCFITIIVGILVSLLTNSNDPPVDPKLISPWVKSFCCCLPKPWRAMLGDVADDDDGNESKYNYAPVDLKMDASRYTNEDENQNGDTATV